MTTQELITKLQKEDPSGELDVVSESGHPIYFPERMEWYYDGRFERIEFEDETFSPRLGTRPKTGEKVMLRTISIDDCFEDADFKVEYADATDEQTFRPLDDNSRKEWKRAEEIAEKWATQT